MEVILLERVPRLGQMGDIVRVRDGYARNFLLPQGKALRASDANRKRFESERAHLEARNLELKTEAQAVASRIDGQSVVLIRQAGTSGQLYGSVTARDIATALSEAGLSVGRSQIVLNQPIKALGVAPVAVRLHPEVEATVSVNVARSSEEAERQARGEDVMETERAEDQLVAEAFFEEAGLAAIEEESEEEPRR